MMNTKRSRAAALLTATALFGTALGCDLERKAQPKPKPTATTGGVGRMSEALGGPKPSSPRAAAAESLPTAFVRERPQQGPRGGVDACAYIGFTGMACLEALLSESDPVKRRYMRRLSNADARLALKALQDGQPAGVAHAEVALFCANSGPCKQKDGDGNELDDGYSCLTKAEAAWQEGDKPAAAKAHARACRCDPKRAQIPVMGGVLACDGAEQPVKRGEKLSLEVAEDVRACGECNPAKGPAACKRELARLASSDAELAAYLRQVHAPRCAKP